MIVPKVKFHLNDDFITGKMFKGCRAGKEIYRATLAVTGDPIMYSLMKVCPNFVAFKQGGL